MSTDNQMIDGLFDLIEWAYQVALDGSDREEVLDEILRGWNDDDTSEQALVLGMLQLWTTLSMQPPGLRDSQRPMVCMEFFQLMSNPGPDDRSRVLFRLQQVLSRRGVYVPNPAARVETPEADAAYEARVAAMRGEQPAYDRRVSGAMGASMDLHQTRMDSIMRLGGWERVR
jgi:hypothetical protein